LVTLRELMREPMVFVCEASHPLANRRRVELADLAGHDFIQLPPGWGIRQRLDKGFAAAGVQPVSAYEVADYAISPPSSFRTGWQAPSCPPARPTASPTYATVPLHPSITWTLSIAYAASQRASPAINALIDTLVRHVD
jgi:DNA-binding transcriptional LysR family regulator